MIVEKLVEIITNVMSASGLTGVFILMTLESMVAPVPSEIVMPFAGYLVLQGRLTIFGALIASSLGSIFGSIISYYIGKHGGRAIVSKYGGYLLLNENHLEWTEKWFKKQGDKTIFASRFIPIVRHLISIPAGIAKMPVHKFLIYTFFGASIWNSILLYAGFKLGQQWEKIHQYSRELDIIFLAGIILLVSYFFWKNYKKNKK